MKKFFVIGKPIKHSLSPTLHNYWFKKHKIESVYEKREINEKDIQNLIDDIRDKKIEGLNITIPYKKTFIPFLDKITLEAEKTQSVNTVYLKNKKIVGHNTDIEGFEISIKRSEYDIENKKVLILGGGGVVPSIIYALKKMNVSKILVSNRTKNKALNLKKLFNNLHIVDWGEIPNFDVVINATSVGLKKEDVLDLKFSETLTNKFFYDVIYNPVETNFLKIGKKNGNLTMNGKMMFIYQASAAFKVWHGIEPQIDSNILKLLEND